MGVGSSFGAERKENGQQFARYGIASASLFPELDGLSRLLNGSSDWDLEILPVAWSGIKSLFHKPQRVLETPDDDTDFSPSSQASRSSATILQAVLSSSGTARVFRPPR
jgi:hypothetical protein